MSSVEHLQNLLINSPSKHHRSALFHKCVLSLKNGANPYEMIDHLVKMNEEMVLKMNDVVSKSPVSYIINTSKYEKPQLPPD